MKCGNHNPIRKVTFQKGYENEEKGDDMNSFSLEMKVVDNENDLKIQTLSWYQRILA